jgi:hypothetical protein
VAVQVDRVVVHGAQVAEAQAHALAELRDERRVPGKARALSVEHVEVRHLVRIGPARAGTIFHSLSMKA